MYTPYHSAAERPKPPHEEQGQEQEQRQQGDQKDGAIELGDRAQTLLAAHTAAQ